MGDDPWEEAADRLPDEEVAEGYGKFGPKVTRYSQIKRKQIYWQWPGRLPTGKLVLLDGDPDVGKSTLMIDLLARFTTGSPMPDGYLPPHPINVLFMRGEDGAADTVLPRLLAAGGDPDRFLEVEAMPDLDRKGKPSYRPPVLPMDVGMLKDIIRMENIDLLLIDPLMAFLDDGIDAHKDQKVRRALSPMSELAQTTHTTILAIRHLNKTIGAPTLYRGGGSIGLLAAARLVMVAAHDPDNENRRLLAVYKSNLAPKPETLAYRIMPNNLYECGEVMWEGASPRSGADLLHLGDIDDDERTAINEAVHFLFEMVTERTPATQVQTWARQAGISEHRLAAARPLAAYTIEKEPGKKNGRLFWCPPRPDAPVIEGPDGGYGQQILPHRKDIDE